jgi:hypothetical protein
MNEFSTKEDKKLKINLVEQGVMFLYLTSSGRLGDMFEVGQSWSSIHSLLSKLRNRQKYSAKDKSLLIWKQGDELHIKFYSLDTHLEEECSFSREDTERLVSLLESLPSLN